MFQASEGKCKAGVNRETCAVREGTEKIAPSLGVHVKKPVSRACLFFSLISVVNGTH